MSGQESVSVIIPNYNRTNQLYTAVTSVLEQSYDEVEIIIVDDSTEEIHDAIKSRYEVENRVLLIRGDPPSDTYIPDAHARKKGVEESDGKYISFLDSDDVWKKDRLKKHVELWQEYPDIGLSWDRWIRKNPDTSETRIFGGIEYQSHSDLTPILHRADDYHIIDGDFVANVLWMNGNFIHMSAGFTTREALQSIGGFPVRGLSDWHLWMCLASNFEVAVLHNPMTTKYLGDNRLAHDGYHSHRSSLDTHLTRVKLLRALNLGKYHTAKEIARGAVSQFRGFLINLFFVSRHFLE